MHSDESLYEKLLEGDLDAFDLLYQRYERPLLGFLVSQLADAHEAEDVLHEAFLAVLKERAAGRSARNFRAWLYQVARHLSLNRVRASQRAARVLQLEARTPSAEAAPVELRLEQLEITDALRKAVARLPAPLAELYQLRASGLSYEELAQVLELPLGTVKSRLHAMTSNLREELLR